MTYIKIANIVALYTHRFSLQDIIQSAADIFILQWSANARFP